MPRRLDAKLMKKIANKHGKSDITWVNKLVSRKASRLGISSEAALVLLAKENDIGASVYQRKLDPSHQAEIRSSGITPLVKTIVQRRFVNVGKKQSSKKPRKGVKVFVVYGRNKLATKSMFDFLRALGLKPLEWSHGIKLTKKSSPYIGEVLDAMFREAIAVVVMFTPDDEARLRRKFWQKRDGKYEKVLSGQARQNVLLEAGMAMGKFPNSTVLVQLGETRPISDINGVHMLHLDNSPEKRQEFVTKLETAGCAVDSSGTYWITTGDFEVCLKK